MADRLDLVIDGEATFLLAFDPPQDADRYLDCLHELRSHLDAALAKPVAWPHSPREGRALTLRVHPQADCPRQGFAIICDSEGLTIQAAERSGLLHGVYTFLERAFGIRWLWPSATGTVIPATRQVSWPHGWQQEAPAWRWRRFGMSGAVYSCDPPAVAELKVAGQRESTRQEFELWCRRNRLGGLRIADGHRWMQICPPQIYGETHPHYFALVDGQRDVTPGNGKHRNQLCTSNPSVVELVADYAIALFDREPELDGFSISANDGSGFCECANCRALDGASSGAEDGAFQEVTADGEDQACRLRNERLAVFANAVAERVAEQHPERLLLLLIYSSHRQPPRTKLHPNVLAQFCVTTWSHHQSTSREHDLGLISALADRTSHLGFYDYFVNGANGSLPRGFWRTWLASAKQYHALGGRYFATQCGMDFALGGFGYYLAAKALWSMEVSCDEVLRDYCQAGFGPVADQVETVLRRFMEVWERHGDSVTLEEQIATLYPPAWRRQQRDLLTTACHAVDDTAIRERLRFLLTGWDFLDLLAEACETTRQEVPDPLLGQRLDTWLRDHGDGFWAAVMWQRYYLTTPTRPLAKLVNP